MKAIVGVFIWLALFWVIFCMSMWVTKRVFVRAMRRTLEDQCATVLPHVPLPTKGTRGIVTCAGGPAYLAEAFASLKALRHTGCTLPVEIYHVGDQEVRDVDRDMFRREFGDSVRFMDATSYDLGGVRPTNLQGFEIKPYAVLLTSFDDILFLDADCAPLKNPEYVFDDPSYKEYGNMFWPDYGVNSNLIRPSWITETPQFPKGFETESGQFVVNKTRCMTGIVNAWLLNKHQKFFYKQYYGDKDLFRLGFVMAGVPFYQLTLSPGIIGSDYWETGQPLLHAMIQKCPRDGRGMLFAHRTMHKRLKAQDIEPSWELYVSNDGEIGKKTTVRYVGHHRGTCLSGKPVERTPRALRDLCHQITRWQSTYAE